MRALETGRPSTLPIEPKRRRRARWIVGSAVVLLLGLGIAFTAYIANYMPLSEAGLGSAGRCVEEVARAALPGTESIRVLQPTCFAKGDVLEVYFALINRGPLPVTVHQVDTWGDDFIAHWGPTEWRSFEVDVSEGWGRSFEEMESGPFTLGVGNDPYDEIRMIAVRVPLHSDCDSGQFSGWTPTLNYRVLGIERTEPLYWPLQLQLRCGR